MKLHPARIALPSFPRRLIAVAAFALCSGQALAAEPFVVKDIRVEGIQRTEAGTVFSYLPVRVGETFTDEKGSAAIKALYATGFFKDVRIESEGNVLVVMVEERPAIASVDFSGIKEFDKEQLTKALKEIGLAESRIFDRAMVDRAEQELKRQYLSRGLYGAKVTTTVTPIERNRVNITFAVDEGDAARIKQITFVGNKVYSDKELHGLLNLTTPGWFTWYTKSDQYTKQKLTGDIESIKSHYLNNGYLEMQIESTQVSISPDKKDIYITVNINEGEKFKVADVKLEGELLGREAELKSLVELKKGDVYSGEKLAESVKKISERMGTFGYAFANVNANPEINREKREVAFTVFIDPGKRVYVRRINVAGNTITRDEVVRREFRQFESSWYDGDKIKNSRNRVDRLGYFNEVNIETPEVPGTSDQVDVNVSVVEKPTGTLSLGAGFSSSERMTLSASVHQANAFGSGKTLGVDVNTSKYNRTIAFSHVDPYVTDDGISRSLEVFYRTSRPPLVNTGEYKIVTTGGSIMHGVPFTELDTIYFGIGVERTKVETYFGVPGFNDSPQVYRDYVAAFGASGPCTAAVVPANSICSATTTSFPLTAAWQRDSRDSVLTPTTGQYQRANLEVAAFGDQRYYRGVYQYQQFLPVFRTMTLALNGELDYGAGMGGKPYPVFKNFYAGGIGSVRGFEGSSLGPRSAATANNPQGDALGGSKRIIANVEFQVPFSGRDRSLRWFTFLDAGNVFAENQKIKTGDLRYSGGLGISWISPIGPLKISYGKPFNAKPGDLTQNFQFQLGTGF
ncbi:outer membrane protein assembly factor BamA [Janthinobacterium sp. 17J80-10]|uniref:outer membrane protein assembly factor BamA n=1 Tax=Janthinobacterium sp. 17J80-10 TaxID=2497863 RepID=UPI0010054A0F|nr:outer membrane protein assembly factor BamA [Janthinobacterium sp. 17J80-10]QAU34621.1 outer membrane protein assembly factor BamA [Janthinobacterium sp. 17J80-10]